MNKNIFYWRSLLCESCQSVYLYQSDYQIDLLESLSAAYSRVYVDSSAKQDDYSHLNNVSKLPDGEIRQDVDAVVIDLMFGSAKDDEDVLIGRISSQVGGDFQLLLLFQNRFYYKNVFGLKLFDGRRNAYSYVSMIKCLHKRGFKIARVFCSKYEINEGLSPLPELSNLASKEKTVFVVNSKIHQIKENIKNTYYGKMTWPAFIVDARYADVRDELCTGGEGKGKGKVIDRLIAGNLDIDVLLIRDQSSGDEYVVRHYNTSVGRDYCQNNFKALDDLSADLSGLIPEKYEEDFSKNYFIETQVQGMNIVRYSGFEKKISLESNVWRDYQNKNLTPVHDVRGYMEDVTNCLRIDDRVSVMIDTILKQLNPENCQHWLFSPIHGDFKVGNMLFDREVRIVGIFDWDHYKKLGIPVYDQITMVMYMLTYEYGMSEEVAFSDMLWDRNIPDVLSEYLEESMDVFGVDVKNWKQLMILFWMANLSWRYTQQDYNNEEFRKRFIEIPLSLFCEYVGK